MAIVDLLMPKMGESIMEATILKWNKQPGESVRQDESLLDIATDKVDSEVPSTAAGILKEILFPADAVVPVGAVIARIESEVNVSSTLNTQHPTPNVEQPTSKEELVLEENTANGQPLATKEEAPPPVIHQPARASRQQPTKIVSIPPWSLTSPAMKT